MTTPERRQVLYSKMFHFMKCHKVITVPVQLGEVCASAGIELVPLSEIVRGTGLPENAVFSIWGNTDGAVNCYQNRYRIAYNDKPAKRTHPVYHKRGNCPYCVRSCERPSL